MQASVSDSGAYICSVPGYVNTTLTLSVFQGNSAVILNLSPPLFSDKVPAAMAASDSNDIWTNSLLSHSALHFLFLFRTF